MKTETQVTCLHIGCGLVTPEGWLNVDASPSLKLSKIPVVGESLVSFMGGPLWPKLAQPGDVVKGLNIKEASCQLIFSAHVLEHLSLSDFQTAMTNIYTYLKPGGVFRAIVPDLEQCVATYQKYRSEPNLSNKAASEFMEATLIGYSPKRSTLTGRFREAFSNSRHQWLWDEASLAEAFTQQGFKNVRRCYYGDWSDPRFEAVEKESNYVGAFGVEGTK